MSFREITNCRACKGELEDIFDFGLHEIISLGDKEPLKSPLHLVKCKSCNLVQLLHTVNPDLLFRKYYYRSGVNQTMRNHLQSIVEDVLQRQKQLDRMDNVIDIGSNDGTLLRNYPTDLVRIGFEPSQLGQEPVTGATIFPRYFNAEDMHGRKAKIITACAVFYDLDDPGKFLDDVKQVLAPDGLFVIEMNYLLAMLDNNRVDNISAEHLCYYSIQTMHPLLDNHGLRIEEVQFHEINGGVFRLYIRHKEFAKVFIDYAVEYGIENIETYHKFVKRVLTNAKRLHNFVQKEARGLKVDVYGASTRGLTLMQLAELDQTNVRYAVERNPSKIGTKYNGIEVVSEDTMRASPPHYLLINIQSFMAEIVQREFELLKHGTKFILPFPEPRILSLETI